MLFTIKLYHDNNRKILVRKPEPDDGVYLLAFRPLLGQFTRRELLVLYDILKAAQTSLELYRNTI